MLLSSNRASRPSEPASTHLAGSRAGTSVLKYRWAANEESNFKRYAAELVALKPDVILASGTSAASALKKTATTIPIVCALVQDPVEAGFAASLARPGGNMTGLTYINPEIIGKWRDLLVQAAPSTTRAALLFNPTINSQYYDYLRDMGPARPGVRRRRPDACDDGRRVAGGDGRTRSRTRRKRDHWPGSSSCSPTSSRWWRWRCNTGCPT